WLRTANLVSERRPLLPGEHRVGGPVTGTRTGCLPRRADPGRRRVGHGAGGRRTEADLAVRLTLHVPMSEQRPRRLHPHRADEGHTRAAAGAAGGPALSPATRLP